MMVRPEAIRLDGTADVPNRVAARFVEVDFVGPSRMFEVTARRRRQPA